MLSYRCSVSICKLKHRLCAETRVRLQNEITHSLWSPYPTPRNADTADQTGWPVAKRWVSLVCTILPGRDARSAASSIMKRSASQEPQPGLKLLKSMSWPAAVFRPQGRCGTAKLHYQSDVREVEMWSSNRKTTGHFGIEIINTVMI